MLYLSLLGHAGNTALSDYPVLLHLVKTTISSRLVQKHTDMYGRGGPRAKEWGVLFVHCVYICMYVQAVVKIMIRGLCGCLCVCLGGGGVAVCMCV